MKKLGITKKLVTLAKIIEVRSGISEHKSLWKLEAKL